MSSQTLLKERTNSLAAKRSLAATELAVEVVDFADTVPHTVVKIVSLIAKPLQNAASLQKFRAQNVLSTLAAANSDL